MRRIRALLFALFLLSPLHVAAALRPSGTLILSTSVFEINPFPPPIGDGRIEVYAPDGTLLETLLSRSGPPFGDVAVDPEQVIYVRSANAYLKLDPAGGQTRVDVPDGGGLAIAADRSVFVNGFFLFKTSSTGQLLSTFDTPSQTGVPIDLAADQCTVFSAIRESSDPTVAGLVNRFDVCAGVALPPLGPSRRLGPGGIRILPSGDILVADVLVGVVRMSASGTVLRTYPLPGAAFLALAPDAASVWVTVRGTARQIDLATGAILASFDTGRDDIRGIAVVGEPRAGFAAGAAGIPALSPVVLILMIALLGAVAVVTLR